MPGLFAADRNGAGDETPLDMREAGEWERIELPNGLEPYMWLAEITHAFRNNDFLVGVRPIEGGVTHLIVSTWSRRRLTWPEMQRIKNEIAGEHATAVEVYPPKDEVVDGDNVYHLWVLPSGLPFGLRHDRDGRAFTFGA